MYGVVDIDTGSVVKSLSLVQGELVRGGPH